MIYVIKKDGTREEFDPQKIVKAVNKSAARIFYLPFCPGACGFPWKE